MSGNCDAADDVDLYSDLPNFQYDESIRKLEEANKSLENKVKSLEKKVENLCKHNERLESENKILGTNISSLFKTATNEIQRKERMIAELRRERDSILFRRGKKHSRGEFNTLEEQDEQNEHNMDTYDSSQYDEQMDSDIRAKNEAYKQWQSESQITLHDTTSDTLKSPQTVFSARRKEKLSLELHRNMLTEQQYLGTVLPVSIHNVPISNQTQIVVEENGVALNQSKTESIRAKLLLMSNTSDVQFHTERLPKMVSTPSSKPISSRLLDSISTSSDIPISYSRSSSRNENEKMMPKLAYSRKFLQSPNFKSLRAPMSTSVKCVNNLKSKYSRSRDERSKSRTPLRSIPRDFKPVRSPQPKPNRCLSPVVTKSSHSKNERRSKSSSSEPSHHKSVKEHYSNYPSTKLKTLASTKDNKSIPNTKSKHTKENKPTHESPNSVIQAGKERAREHSTDYMHKCLKPALTELSKASEFEGDSQIRSTKKKSSRKDSENSKPLSSSKTPDLSSEHSESMNNTSVSNSLNIRPKCPDEITSCSLTIPCSKLPSDILQPIVETPQNPIESPSKRQSPTYKNPTIFKEGKVSICIFNEHCEFKRPNRKCAVRLKLGTSSSSPTGEKNGTNNPSNIVNEIGQRKGLKRSLESDSPEKSEALGSKRLKVNCNHKSGDATEQLESDHLPNFNSKLENTLNLEPAKCKSKSELLKSSVSVENLSRDRIKALDANVDVEDEEIVGTEHVPTCYSGKDNKKEKPKRSVRREYEIRPREKFERSSSRLREKYKLETSKGLHSNQIKEPIRRPTPIWRAQGRVHSRREYLFGNNRRSSTPTFRRLSNGCERRSPSELLHGDQKIKRMRQNVDSGYEVEKNRPASCRSICYENGLRPRRSGSGERQRYSESSVDGRKNKARSDRGKVEEKGHERKRGEEQRRHPHRIADDKGDKHHNAGSVTKGSEIARKNKEIKRLNSKKGKRSDQHIDRISSDTCWKQNCSTEITEQNESPQQTEHQSSIVIDNQEQYFMSVKENSNLSLQERNILEEVQSIKHAELCNSNDGSITSSKNKGSAQLNYSISHQGHSELENSYTLDITTNKMHYQNGNVVLSDNDTLLLEHDSGKNCEQLCHETSKNSAGPLMSLENVKKLSMSKDGNFTANTEARIVESSEGTPSNMKLNMKKRRSRPCVLGDSESLMSLESVKRPSESVYGNSSANTETCKNSTRPSTSVESIKGPSDSKNGNCNVNTETSNHSARPSISVENIKGPSELLDGNCNINTEANPVENSEKTPTTRLIMKKRRSRPCVLGDSESVTSLENITRPCKSTDGNCISNIETSQDSARALTSLENIKRHSKPMECNSNVNTETSKSSARPSTSVENIKGPSELQGGICNTNTEDSSVENNENTPSTMKLITKKCRSRPCVLEDGESVTSLENVERPCESTNSNCISITETFQNSARALISLENVKRPCETMEGNSDVNTTETSKNSARPTSVENIKVLLELQDTNCNGNSEVKPIGNSESTPSTMRLIMKKRQSRPCVLGDSESSALLGNIEIPSKLTDGNCNINTETSKNSARPSAVAENNKGPPDSKDSNYNTKSEARPVENNKNIPSTTRLIMKKRRSKPCVLGDSETHILASIKSKISPNANKTGDKHDVEPHSLSTKVFYKKTVDSNDQMANESDNSESININTSSSNCANSTLSSNVRRIVKGNGKAVVNSLTPLCTENKHMQSEGSKKSNYNKPCSKMLSHDQTSTNHYRHSALCNTSERLVATPPDFRQRFATVFEHYAQDYSVMSEDDKEEEEEEVFSSSSSVSGCDSDMTYNPKGGQHKAKRKRTSSKSKLKTKKCK